MKTTLAILTLALSGCAELPRSSDAFDAQLEAAIARMFNQDGSPK